MKQDAQQNSSMTKQSSAEYPCASDIAQPSSPSSLNLPTDGQTPSTKSDHLTPAAGEITNSYGPNNTNVSILVIEDDIDTASLVADALNDHFGREVVTSIRTLREIDAIAPRQFDIVLCDYNLPDGNGLDALRMFRSDELPVPFVLVTGQNEIKIALQALEQGAYDYVVKSTEFISLLPLMVEKNLSRYRIKEEYFRLQRELELSLEQVRESHGQLTSMIARLESMALTDELTGLSNRRHLNEELPRLFAQSQRYNSDLTCIMIDLDGFKQINDTLGHQHGDDLLRLAGRLISANRRDADFAARYGGDEFVILLPQTSQETAGNLARRLMAQFSQATASASCYLTPVNMSIGIASAHTAHPSSGENLLQLADKALYRAKASGKAAVMNYEADFEDKKPSSSKSAAGAGSTPASTSSSTQPASEEREPRHSHA